MFIKERIDDYELLQEREEKLYGLLKRIIVIYRIIFNRIIVKRINENEMIMIIPRVIKLNKLKIKNKKIYNKKVRKLIVKIRNELSKNDIKKIILSKEIKKEETLVLNLRINNLEVVNGTLANKLLVNKTLEYIYKYRKTKMEDEILYLLIDNLDEIIAKQIRRFAKQYKNIYIISDHREQFNLIEEELYNKEGIILLIGNNRKKCLINANIIINYDFNNKMLDKFVINKSAILINLKNNNSSLIKRKITNGIYVSSIKINFEEVEEDYDKYNIYNQFDYLDIYEIQAYKLLKNIMKNEYIEMLKKKSNNSMQTDSLCDKIPFKVEVSKLEGINGMIEKEEFVNV